MSNEHDNAFHNFSEEEFQQFEGNFIRAVQVVLDCLQEEGVKPLTGSFACLHLSATVMKQAKIPKERYLKLCKEAWESAITLHKEKVND